MEFYVSGVGETRSAVAVIDAITSRVAIGIFYQLWENAKLEPLVEVLAGQLNPNFPVPQFPRGRLILEDELEAIAKANGDEIVPCDVEGGELVSDDGEFRIPVKHEEL